MIEGLGLLKELVVEMADLVLEESDVFGFVPEVIAELLVPAYYLR